MVYSVPDSVADRLDEYCLAFTEWLYASPHARKYRIGGGLCYNEADFISYLNRWIFPELSPRSWSGTWAGLTLISPFPSPGRTARSLTSDQPQQAGKRRQAPMLRMAFDISLAVSPRAGANHRVRRGRRGSG